MGSSKYFTLKEARLSNNCPECYSNDGLEITFKQKLTENIFYKAITSETSHHMHCYNCNTTIFPVRWTDDIERVVEYQQRAIQPSTKINKVKTIGLGIYHFRFTYCSYSNSICNRCNFFLIKILCYFFSDSLKLF